MSIFSCISPKICLVLNFATFACFEFEAQLIIPSSFSLIIIIHYPCISSIKQSKPFSLSPFYFCFVSVFLSLIRSVLA
ncbi:hypothetical protein BY458DRAFT_503791 [Sporodiniella umbellata]|nr:hypothetical protein BY458DRAFT_503791 [Sporodiniella umbellata]